MLCRSTALQLLHLPLKITNKGEAFVFLKYESNPGIVGNEKEVLHVLPVTHSFLLIVGFLFPKITVVFKYITSKYHRKPIFKVP